MQKHNVLIASFGLAALLSACGGGSGGGADINTGEDAAAGVTGGTFSPVLSEPATSAPATSQRAITVSAMTAPNISTSDCSRLFSEADSIAALDLSNSNIKAVNDYVKAADADHAYKVFIRRPYDFVNWIAAAGGTVNLGTIGTATHETLHMTDSVLAFCAPARTYKTLFFGNVLVSGLRQGDTASIRIVDTFLDTALKTGARYDSYLYIKTAPVDNDFSVLLDEFAAYTGSAHTDLQMIAKGKTTADTGTYDAGLGGTVNFMVFLQNYLKAARLNDIATYENIRNNAQTIALIQAIWTRAEKVLQDSYPYTEAMATTRLTIDGAYFSAAYSADLLAELDAIGVTHATRASWAGMYLQ